MCTSEEKGLDRVKVEVYIKQSLMLLPMLWSSTKVGFMIFSPRKKTQGTKYKIAVVIYMYYFSLNARVDLFPTQSHPYAHAQLLPKYVWCRCLGEFQCVATK